MEKLNVKLTFQEPLLGTLPGSEDLYMDYIATKVPEDERTKIEDEVAALGVDAVAEKKMTVFPKLPDGLPFVYDYQIRGFFKGSCGALRKISKARSAKLKAYKKEVDQLIFVYPRKIPIQLSGDMDVISRPLRAATPQGDRVAIAASESAPAGSSIALQIICFDDNDMKIVREWLEYGMFNGLGQWRNSGMGRFTWEEVPESEIPGLAGKPLAVSWA